ncbi:hypothetical protein RSJ42_15850 [Methanosarcina hadiensis]|uniref:hypothetical protein n=1 Tax=Methanosarcina hadiensis TaxID=3078083 RepID=UPI003977CE5F
MHLNVSGETLRKFIGLQLIVLSFPSIFKAEFQLQDSVDKSRFSRIKKILSIEEESLQLFNLKKQRKQGNQRDKKGLEPDKASQNKKLSETKNYLR